MCSRLVGRGFGFIFAVEDQRDWQGVRGCSRSPFSCFFCHLLSVLGVERVLDVTYGVGSFYLKCPSLDIVGSDIRKWDWVVKPSDFILGDMTTVVSAVRGGFDAVVIDPPYNTKPSSRIGARRVFLYYGHVGFGELLSVINTVKRRALGRYIILKYMPASLDEESTLLHLAEYRVTWRFVRYSIPAHSGNVIIRNYTEVYIIPTGD